MPLYFAEENKVADWLRPFSCYFRTARVLGSRYHPNRSPPLDAGGDGDRARECRLAMEGPAGRAYAGMDPSRRGSEEEGRCRSGSGSGLAWTTGGAKVRGVRLHRGVDLEGPHYWRSINPMKKVFISADISEKGFPLGSQGMP